MKVGFVLSHLKVRKDLSDMLLEMARQGVQPVVFSSDSSDRLHVPRLVEFRKVHSKGSVRNRFFIKLQRLVGETPRSRKNFFYATNVKLAKLAPARRLISRASLWLRCYVTGFVPQETFLDFMAPYCAAQTSDLECFVLSTPCLDPSAWAIARSSELPCHYYVYSWDHPGKADLLPRDGRSYMTWAPNFSKDLVELCGIAPSKITPVGSTQLSYIQRYLSNERPQQDRELYLYYGCAWGYDAQWLEELSGLRRIASLVRKHFPHLKLLIRPYVMRTANSAMLDLGAEPSIEFDRWFSSDLSAAELNDDAVFHRLSLQDHAVLFVHAGTTMGLEGAHLSSPMAFLGPEWFGLGSRIARGQLIQEHFQRHIFRKELPNYVKSDDDLIEMIGLALARDPSVFAYSKILAKAAPLGAMHDVVAQMRRVICVGRPPKKDMHVKDE